MYVQVHTLAPSCCSLVLPEPGPIPRWTIGDICPPDRHASFLEFHPRGSLSKPTAKEGS